MKEREQFLANMKTQLLLKRDELLAELNMSKQQGRMFEGQVKDSADEAFSAMFEKIKNSLEESEINKIHQIEKALVRVDTGQYGLCVDCGEQIADKRLNIYPYAARCIICQEAVERK